MANNSQSSIQDSGILSDRNPTSDSLLHGAAGGDQSSLNDSAAEWSLSELVDVDEEIDTPFKAYKRLQELFTNEDNAPELLTIDEDITTAIFEQVEHMQDNLRRMGHTLEAWALNIHKLEVDRYTYLLSAYLRRRLEKIEHNAHRFGRLLKHNPAALTGLMSDAEIKYLAGYVTNLDEHLSESVLERLPSNVQPFSVTDVDKNDHESTRYDYVFVRAQKKVTLHVPMPDGTTELVHMEKGSQKFLPFAAVRSLLMSGSRHVILL